MQREVSRGLEIKDVECFNIALLMKWKWRINNEENALWRNFLNYRCVSPKMKMFVNDKRVILNKDSI